MNIRYIIALSVYIVYMLIFLVFTTIITVGASAKSHLTSLHYILYGYVAVNLGAIFLFTALNNKTSLIAAFAAISAIVLTLIVVVRASIDIFNPGVSLIYIIAGYPGLAFSGSALSFEIFLALRTGFLPQKRKRNNSNQPLKKS